MANKKIKNNNNFFYKLYKKIKNKNSYLKTKF